MAVMPPNFGGFVPKVQPRHDIAGSLARTGAGARDQQRIDEQKRAAVEREDMQRRQQDEAERSQQAAEGFTERGAQIAEAGEGRKAMADKERQIAEVVKAHREGRTDLGTMLRAMYEEPVEEAPPAAVPFTPPPVQAPGGIGGGMSPQQLSQEQPMSEQQFGGMISELATGAPPAPGPAEAAGPPPAAAPMVPAVPTMGVPGGAPKPPAATAFAMKMPDGRVVMVDPGALAEEEFAEARKALEAGMKGLRAGLRPEQREAVMQGAEEALLIMTGGDKEAAQKIAMDVMKTEMPLLSAERRAEAMALAMAKRTGGGKDDKLRALALQQFDKTVDKGAMTEAPKGWKTLSEGLSKVEKDPQSAAGWNEMLYAISRAQQGNRVTDKDVEMASGADLADLIDRLKSFGVKSTIGGPGDERYEDVMAMVRRSRNALNARALLEYRTLKDYQDIYYPGGGKVPNRDAYLIMDGRLKGIYGRMPWWNRVHKPRRLPPSVTAGTESESESKSVSGRGRRTLERLNAEFGLGGP